ncbi:MAG: hypothetical protein HY769_10675 [Candidatus Stahlbacteria bacterium]|nr:hypothetical protein [Candidatus Stahlbacteria bacterium]
MFFLFLLQGWGIGGGVLSIPKIITSPVVGIYHGIDISDRVWICESMRYWQAGYQKVKGTSSKDCVFSAMSFTETGLLKLKAGKLEFSAGPGIGLHLLKNRVKERNEYKDYIITDYYCLNSTAIGFHIDGEIGFRVKQLLVSIIARVGAILLNPNEENLFYTRGNLTEVNYLLRVLF